MNAFSTKFEGTNSFSKSARKKKQSSKNVDADYIREIRKKKLVEKLR